VATGRACVCGCGSAGCQPAYLAEQPVLTCRASAQAEVGLWGHEYVRNIAGEIGQEYAARREREAPVDDLLELVADIVPYHMSHNAGAAPVPRLSLPLTQYCRWHPEEYPSCRTGEGSQGLERPQ